MSTKNLETIKTISIVVGAVALVYGMIIVPSQQLAIAHKSIEISETRVYNSCILLAEQSVQGFITSAPEGEEPTEDQINNFLNARFTQCIIAEGYDPQVLNEKYGLAQAPTPVSEEPQVVSEEL